MAHLSVLLAVMLTFFCSSMMITSTLANHYEITHDEKSLMFNGKRKIIISGAIHYPRSTPQMWPSLIKKAKEGGLNAIETYVFWNAHEPSPRKYNFKGNLDLVKFLKIVRDEGLFAILRVGPYVCAEWNYGGLPVWLHNMGDVTMRTNDTTYMKEMQTFTTYVVDMVKKNALFASQGGPIILAQIENEYGDIMKGFGSSGESYISWCANLTATFDAGVPWIMCQQPNAPSPMLETGNGFYGDKFQPSDKRTPKMWTENWSGWFQNWGSAHPHRPAEDLAFAVGRFFQKGGSFLNYYMYHGGTNFGRTAGGPNIVTSYDYDAPLNEYGNPNQPKWGHLKQFHSVIMAREDFITEGVSKLTKYDGNGVEVTEYTHNGKRICYIGNWWNMTGTYEFEGTTRTAPAWSVAIFDDCNKEVFNTARVNVQTSVMVKKPMENHPEKLNWTWRYEYVDKFEIPAKRFRYENQILEQKAATNDVSDYLWYMTSVTAPQWNEFRLRVRSWGHILHAWIDQKYIGSLFNSDNNGFLFEQNVMLKPGKKCKISLLSVTVGLPNYGAFFDRVNQGIKSVKFVNPVNKKEIDMSKNLWAYKVGLNGVKRKIYEGDARHDAQFKSDNLPKNRMLTWYKTSFQTPAGDDPVVLDLLGMGKGIAYVNGYDIGRYWPAAIGKHVRDCDFCEFINSYSGNECQRQCGEPSQRWYHVPRSFLKPNTNTLTLFEEFGGDTDGVKIGTVRMWKACGNAEEGQTLELSCDGGRVMKQIRYAHFGATRGECGAFEQGFCGSRNSKKVIEHACLGKETCSIEVLEENFTPSNCAQNITRTLAVEAVCR